MIEQRARLRRVRDRSVFVGNPDDVVDLPFGPGLSEIREWTWQNFDIAGYVTRRRSTSSCTPPADGRNGWLQRCARPRPPSLVQWERSLPSRLPLL